MGILGYDVNLNRWAALGNAGGDSFDFKWRQQRHANTVYERRIVDFGNDTVEWGHAGLVHRRGNGLLSVDEDLNTYTRDGFDYQVYHDPGQPALHAMDGSGSTEIYQTGHGMVALWSGMLDPTDGVMWDISPGSIGNRTSYPTTLETYATLYDATNGGSPSPGHDVNPATGEAYAPNVVPRGDYARVLAEFWADGPDSETPPGHWFTILNYVSDHPELVKQFQGEGPGAGRFGMGRQGLPRPGVRHARLRHLRVGRQRLVRLVSAHHGHPRHG